MPQLQNLLLICLVVMIALPAPAAAFGAGNIASISHIEGHNWRHGDIEDMLKTVAFLRGHKWTSDMIKRVYFGNWLRDYSQAIDVGTVKGVQADTVRVLVWVLSFLSFGYATEEFEVTADRLGVYRPEEHIDNPKDYADNVDARQYDPRLRGPVSPVELAIDPETGMKNYISNESGGWATSYGYLKFSFARSLHFGRMYTHGPNRKNKDDLYEALRCLGQGLHCMEDFGAHSNYTELALLELGYRDVFPHVGSQTRMNIHGKHVFPLVTGTFGGVDFLHSVLGEATDHVTQAQVDQSEVDQLNNALGTASASQNSGSRGLGDPASKCSDFTNLLGQVPGCGDLAEEAVKLQAASDAQAAENERVGVHGETSRAGDASATFQRPPGSQGGPPGPGIPGTNIDPKQVVANIYPFLAFRDKVVRQISSVVSKIPGLEKIIETISEKVTIFILGLLAPFLKPIIATASKALKEGSGTVVGASANQQFLVWEDHTSTDPTHSLLSKDHFSNILNDPAGQVASEILQYVVPRIIYGWEHPEVDADEIFRDIGRAFHHPALRDRDCELHMKMFSVVKKWARSRPHGSPDLNVVLGSDSVRNGKNHTTDNVAESFQPLQGYLGKMTAEASSGSGPVGSFLPSFLTGTRELDLDDEPRSRGASFPVDSSGRHPAPQSNDPASYGQPQHGYGGSGDGYGQQRSPPHSGYGQEQSYGGYEQQQPPLSQYSQQPAYPPQQDPQAGYPQPGYPQPGGYGDPNASYGQGYPGHGQGGGNRYGTY